MICASSAAVIVRLLYRNCEKVQPRSSSVRNTAVNFWPRSAGIVGAVLPKIVRRGSGRVAFAPGVEEVVPVDVPPWVPLDGSSYRNSTRSASTVTLSLLALDWKKDFPAIT